MLIIISSFGCITSNQKYRKVYLSNQEHIIVPSDFLGKYPILFVQFIVLMYYILFYLFIFNTTVCVNDCNYDILWTPAFPNVDLLVSDPYSPYLYVSYQSDPFISLVDPGIPLPPPPFFSPWLLFIYWRWQWCGAVHKIRIFFFLFFYFIIIVFVFILLS